jgi:hypothetical protein
VAIRAELPRGRLASAVNTPLHIKVQACTAEICFPPASHGIRTDRLFVKPWTGSSSRNHVRSSAVLLSQTGQEEGLNRWLIALLLGTKALNAGSNFRLDRKLPRKRSP